MKTEMIEKNGITFQVCNEHPGYRFNKVFGGGSSKPKLQKVEPIQQQIQQTPEERQSLYKQLAKRRKATVVNQIESEARTRQQTLGASR